MTYSMRRFIPLLSGLAFLTGCESDLTSHDRELAPIGAVEGSVFLDVNGSGTIDGPDDPIPGLEVQVRTANGGIVATTVTDVNGQFRQGELPIGVYRLTLDEDALPPDVEVLRLNGASEFTLGVRVIEDIVNVHDADFLVSFASFTLAQVRDLPAGRQVVSHGIVLNSRPNFGDGVVHFQEGDTYLRAIEVERGNMSPGDSVRIIGRTARDLGLPILRNVSVQRLVPDAAIVNPVPVSTRDAARADGGDLDAALVRMNDAEITDIREVQDGYIITADDGSGPVELLVRDYLQINPGAFVPDEAILTSAQGLLVPYEAGSEDIRWRITPRGGGDLNAQAIED